jgi:hypothetical protein
MTEISSNKYLDQCISSSIEKELETINNLSPDDIIYHTIKLIPSWIRYTCKHYTNDYIFLEKNWSNLCNVWNTTQKEILIVDFLPRNQSFENLRILELLCNKLTKHGYVIRTYNELVPCKVCKNAQITKLVYEHIKHNLPREWKDVCSLCE